MLLFSIRSHLTSISIAGEVTGPGDEGVSLMLTGGNRVDSDGAHNGCVAKFRLGRDDTIGDVVINGLSKVIISASCNLTPPPDGETMGTYGMLLLLHLENSAILEGPLDDVRVGRRSLDPFTVIQSGVKLVKVLQLNQVPDIAERRLNDSRLANKGRSGDSGRHFAKFFQFRKTLCIFVRYCALGNQVV